MNFQDVEGHMKDPGRWNVGLTRARRFLSLHVSGECLDSTDKVEHWANLNTVLASSNFKSNVVHVDCSKGMQHTCAQSRAWLGAEADIKKLRTKDAYEQLVAHLSPLSERVATMVDHTVLGLHQARRQEAKSFSAGLHRFLLAFLKI